MAEQRIDKLADRVSELEEALQGFVEMVEEDKIMTTNEHRQELIETLTFANAALSNVGKS